MKIEAQYVHKTLCALNKTAGNYEHSFCCIGILDMRFDTPIEVTEDTGSTETQAKCCGSKLLEAGSTIARTLSTTEVIDCEEVLKEAQAIREKRKNKEHDNVVSGNYILNVNAVSNC